MEEHFERNRKLMSDFHINDNIVIHHEHYGPQLGVVTCFHMPYRTKKVELGVSMVTVTGFKDSDPPLFWSIDPDVVHVEKI